MSVSFLRLQTHDGLGAYRGSAYYTVIQFYSGWLTEHPMPDHDPLLVAQDYQNFSIMYGEAMRFGFSDQTQFLFVDGEPTKMFRRSRQLVWLHNVSDDIIIAEHTNRPADGWRLAYIWTLIEVH